MNAARPFVDLQVLDLSLGVAGPYCGMLLAHYGARVTKLEPPGGDWVRGLGTTVGDHSAYALAYNVGKRSLAVDLKADAGRAVALRLGERADVVIESFRPGVAARLGVDYAAVAAINPQVVYASVSGYGQRGPYAGRALTDTVAQAFSGLMSINPGMDGVPHKINATIVDTVTGLYAFQAVSVALYARRAGAPGTHLDLSLMGAAAALQTPKILAYHMEDGAPGALNPPAGSYRTRDGWVAITLVTEAQFERLCRAVDLPALAEDPRYASFGARARHLDTLVETLQARLLERTTAQWLERFAAGEVLANAINDYGDWLEDPHVCAVDAAPMTEVTVGIEAPFPAVPGLAPAVIGPAPKIGEHSREVLREIGYTAAEVERLMAEGVVFEGAAR